MQTPIHRRRWKCQIQFVITIRNVATEVYEKVMASKKRVEAKAMPKTTEAPPTPESVKKVKGLLERMKKEKKEPVFKDPPAKPLAQLQSRPSADNPAKATETTADYTAKSGPKEPPYQPPKSNKKFQEHLDQRGSRCQLHQINLFLHLLNSRSTNKTSSITIGNSRANSSSTTTCNIISIKACSTTISTSKSAI